METGWAKVGKENPTVIVDRARFCQEKVAHQTVTNLVRIIDHHHY